MLLVLLLLRHSQLSSFSLGPILGIEPLPDLIFDLEHHDRIIRVYKEAPAKIILQF